jgi:tetratricopeptide (TPR) repeat protein
MTGCARVQKGQTEHIEVPSHFTSVSDFGIGINQFALLQNDAPERELLRQRLLEFVSGYIVQQLDRGDGEEAMAAFDQALALFTPAELRAKTAQAPGLAKAARRVYVDAAKTGNEDPALLGLGVMYQFGSDADRKVVADEWEHLEAWVESGSVYARDLRHVGGAERRLEEIASVFPSPWIVGQLERIYLDRYRAARKAQSRGEPVDDAQAHRIKYTPYLLARVHLRADDLEAAADALDEARDPYMLQLKDKIEAALKPGRNAQALNDLIAEMRPADGEDSLPDSVQTQAWGVVDNLALRALARHPNDPFAHYFRAEALRRHGLRHAAMIHYERVLEQKKDLFEVWAHLAELYDEHLQRLAATDPEQALAALPKVEALHSSAVETWKDRPIQPGLARAYVVVADGLYDDGRPDEALELLEKAVALEAEPEALEMLGTIAFRQSNYDRAWTRYEELMLLPFEDQRARLFWEIRAQTRLGEIAIQSGRPAAGERQLKSALTGLNQLLAWPQLSPDGRVSHLVERSRVLFYLGESELAMNDFRAAASITPDFALVYAEPMLFACGHGFYDQALEIFELAIGNQGIDPSLRLYFSMWMVDLAQRQGFPAPNSATAYLEKYKGEGWHKALAAHARGKLDYKALLGQAKDAGHRAEAHFYEGLRRWRDGDADGGLQLMRKVLDTQMMSFFEYEMAQNYLSWKALPVTARSPLASEAAKKTN